MHDHNGPCCLKIPVWNKPLFCSLNSLWLVFWNLCTELAWTFKSWLREWILGGESKICSALKFGTAFLLGEQRCEWWRKMLLHPLRRDWSVVFNTVCSSGPPSQAQHESRGNKSLAFAKEKSDPQCQFFCVKNGWIQCFPFSLHPAARFCCVDGQAGEQIMNLPKCGYWYSWDHYTYGSCELSHVKGRFSEGCGHDINSLISYEISAGEVLSLGVFLKSVIMKVNPVSHLFFFFSR